MICLYLPYCLNGQLDQLDWTTWTGPTVGWHHLPETQHKRLSIFKSGKFDESLPAASDRLMAPNLACNLNSNSVWLRLIYENKSQINVVSEGIKTLKVDNRNLKKSWIHYVINFPFLGFILH